MSDPCTHEHVDTSVYDYCEDCGAVRLHDAGGRKRYADELYEWHTCPRCCSLLQNPCLCGGGAK